MSATSRTAGTVLVVPPSAATCTTPVRNSTCDPSACAMCGDRIADHRAEVLPAYAPVEVALWRWFVAHGGRWDTFGGVDVSSTDVVGVRAHLERCAVDVDASSLPVIDERGEFVDTFSPAKVVSVTSGVLCCECGLVDGVEWAVPGARTFGELLSEVLAAGVQPS